MGHWKDTLAGSLWVTPLAPSCMPCLCRKPCVWAPRCPSACLGVLFLLLTRSFPRFSSCLLVFFLRGAPGVISAFSLRHDSLFVLRVSFLSLPVRGSAYTTCLIFFVNLQLWTGQSSVSFPSVWKSQLLLWSLITQDQLPSSVFPPSPQPCSSPPFLSQDNNPARYPLVSFPGLSSSPPITLVCKSLLSSGTHQ